MNNIIKDLEKIKVEQLENKNQFVITYCSNDNLYICFQSYKTLIAIYDYSNNELYINWSMWDYSKTTMKHLKVFVNRYTTFKYENKSQFMKEITNNNSIYLLSE